MRCGPKDWNSPLAVCQVVVRDQAVVLEHHVCELATGNLELVQLEVDKQENADDERI